jgi:hypothetical protein
MLCVRSQHADFQLSDENWIYIQRRTVTSTVAFSACFAASVHCSAWTIAGICNATAPCCWQRRTTGTHLDLRVLKNAGAREVRNVAIMNVILRANHTISHGNCKLLSQDRDTCKVPHCWAALWNDNRCTDTIQVTSFTIICLRTKSHHPSLALLVRT